MIWLMNSQKTNAGNVKLSIVLISKYSMSMFTICAILSILLVKSSLFGGVYHCYCGCYWHKWGWCTRTNVGGLKNWQSLNPTNSQWACLSSTQSYPLNRWNLLLWCCLSLGLWLLMMQVLQVCKALTYKMWTIDNRFDLTNTQLASLPSLMLYSLNRWNPTL